MTDVAVRTARVGRHLLLVWMIALGAVIALLAVCVVVRIGLGERAGDELILRLTRAAAAAPVLCAVGLLAASVMRRAQLGVFMLAAMAMVAAAAAWWAIVFWRWDDLDDAGPLRVPITFTVVGTGLAVLGHLLTSPDRRAATSWIRAVLLASITLLCCALMAWVWSRWWQSRMIGLAILLGVGASGTVAGVLALFVADRYLAVRDRRRAESLPQRVRLGLECPRCELEQEMAAGLSRCRRCGLALLIQIEEPRCACGYVLFGLAGDTCPECGRTVGG